MEKNNLGREYQICTKCVMDTSDPIITFNENGICDHCVDFAENVLPNWNTDKRGRAQLEKIIDKIKRDGRDKDYDCLLGISGGVDSSIMLHMAVKEFGLRPLVFHVDGGWNSEIAVHNINVMIDKLGLDLYTEVINWEEMKDFQLAFFKSGVPHLDIPQDHAFIATLYYFAEKHKIKYILNGGNYSTECVQYPMEWFYYGTDMLHIKDIRDKFGTNSMETYPFSSVFRHKIYLKYIKGVHVIKPLNYVPFIKEDALGLLEKEYGWKRYAQKHFESRFTKFYEGYWLAERFGYDTRRVQFSSLILTNQMTRDEAIKKLNEPAYDPAEIEDEFNYIATKLGIPSQELQKYFNLPRKFYWDYKNQQKIFRLGARVLHLLGVEKLKKRKK
jgi:N-acetyl sugar amidotransferase